MSATVAFIGGGNPGMAVAEGHLKGKFSNSSELTITRRNIAALQQLKEKGETAKSDNAAGAKKSDGSFRP